MGVFFPLSLFSLMISLNTKAYPSIGEPLLVTSRGCHNLCPRKARSCVPEIGNSFPCRFFQLPEHGSQFIHAKAFEQFVPVGFLLAQSIWDSLKKPARLLTRVNRKVKQNAHLDTDLFYQPARVLKWVSQGMKLLFLRERG